MDKSMGSGDSDHYECGHHLPHPNLVTPGSILSNKAYQPSRWLRKAEGFLPLSPLESSPIHSLFLLRIPFPMLLLPYHFGLLLELAA